MASILLITWVHERRFVEKSAGSSGVRLDAGAGLIVCARLRKLSMNVERLAAEGLSVEKNSPGTLSAVPYIISVGGGVEAKQDQRK